MIACDPAASGATHADYSAIVVMAADGLGPEAKTWVLQVKRGQWEIPRVVKELVEVQKRWKCLIAVEAVAGFKAVPQMLKHVDPSLRILEIHPTTDKFTRAQPVGAAWNAGNVLVPIGYGEDGPQMVDGQGNKIGNDATPKWVDPFISEVMAFTGVKDPADDQVDGLAHCWNSFASAVKRKPRRSRRAQGAFG